MFKRKEKKQEIIQTAVSEGIPAEVVAAISGAVAVICGGEAQITGIRPAIGRAASAGRSAWSMAGLLENTRPF
jgi:hypothetical protein